MLRRQAGAMSKSRIGCMSRRRRLQIVASEGKILEDTCYYRTRGLRRIQEVGLGEFDELFLLIFRHLCASLSSDTEHGTAAAQEHAARALGEPEGTLFVRNTIELLYAIRAERRGEFSFMAAECPVCRCCLSDEEWTTLMLLRAARRGDDAAVVDQAQRLIGGSAILDVAIAARVLGVQLEAHADGPARAAVSRSTDAQSWVRHKLD